MDWGNIVIGGVAIAPLIVALIEWLKNQGLPSQYAAWLCGGLAVVAYVVSAILIPMYPDLAQYAQWVVGALVVFLTSTGVYQLTKPTTKQN